MNDVLYYGSIALGLFLWLVTSHARRRAVHRLREEIETARGEADIFWTRAERAEQRAAVLDKRATDYFAVIETIEKEAETWRKMYKQQMAMSSNAQNWLFRDLSTAIRKGNVYATRLRKLGEEAPPIDLSPGLKETLEQFKAAGEIDIPVAPGLDHAAEREAQYQQELAPLAPETGDPAPTQ